MDKRGVKMDVSKNLFKSSLIYFVGQVLSKIISFLLLPLYTNYISTTDFGYYDLSISVLGVVVPVIFMEIWTATLRFSLERKTDQEKRLVINNTMMIAGTSLLLYSFIFAIAAFVFKFDLPIWIYLYSFIWICQLFLLSVSRVFGKNALYASSGVISVLFNAVVTVIAVYVTNGNIVSLFLGMIVSMLVQVLIINHSVKVFKEFSFSDFDADLCRTMIHFSLPLCFNSVMYWMLEGFNKIVITYFLGLAVTGVYAVGNRISVVLNLIISVFSLSWQETIFKLTDKNEKYSVYNTGFNLLIKSVGSGLVLLLPIISILFPYIVGNEYLSARNLIPFLLLVIFVNALSSLLASCFAAEKDTKGLLASKIVACVVNVITLFSTISFIGFYSSPLALFIANVVGVIVQIKLLEKHIRIIPQYSNIVVFVVTFIISMAVYLSESVILNLIWLAIASIFFCFYLKEFIMKMFGLVKSMIPHK